MLVSQIFTLYSETDFPSDQTFLKNEQAKLDLLDHKNSLYFYMRIKKHRKNL
jgi:hypothetical protein